MTESIAGSCVCGAVSFQIAAPFKTFQYCHCSRCRKRSGSAHASNIFLPADQLTWEKGEDQVRRFELPTAKWWCNAFCQTCGSSLPWLTRNGKTMIVPAGTLDDDPEIRPERNVYHGSRAPWYVPTPEVETYETYPGA